MQDSYEQLKKITDSYYSGSSDSYAPEIRRLLLQLNVSLRSDDGKPYSLQVSIPKSRRDCIVIGVRYIKRDDTFTEDCFLFEKGVPVKKCYKGLVEKIFPEYKGTHKAQVRVTEERI